MIDTRPLRTPMALHGVAVGAIGFAWSVPPV
jgi:hypothetical protein